MTELFECERCGLDFKEKKHLIQHLKKKEECLPLFLDTNRQEIIDSLKQKKGLMCEKCKKNYSSKYYLEKHKCLSKNGQIKSVEKLEIELKEVKDVLKKLLDKPQVPTTVNIDNSTTNNITNNTVNVQLNCFMDTTGKPIEYLLNSENLKEKILSWINSKTGLLEYIDEKFYNPQHPENQMIKKGNNNESIKLHISGKWKQLNNIKASDLILTNVGNDFMVYMDNIKENEEEYKNNKKILRKFESEVMKPLEWGIELSEDSNNIITKTIVKNDKGEYVYLEDELEIDKKLELTKDLITFIHNK